LKTFTEAGKKYPLLFCIVYIVECSLYIYRLDGKREQVGGYRHQFVQPPPEPLVCKLCLLPARDPHLSQCCRYNFCASCLDNYSKNESKKMMMCPCYGPYAYFAPYAYGTAHTRMGWPICVWALLLTHTRMGQCLKVFIYNK